MFKKILVPLDGSELAERALPPAMTIARKAQGEIILLRVPAHQQVILPSTAGYGLPLSEETIEHDRGRVESYLSAVGEEWQEPGLTIHTQALVGDVAGTIIDTASIEDADLIVISTHGYSGIRRWMLGSIAERVLRAAPCPVMVIRDTGPIKRVMVTLDGSRLAEEALRPGLEIARVLNCTTTLFRVDQHEKLSNVELGMLEAASNVLSQEVAQANTDRVSSYLECMAEKYRSPGQDIGTTVLKGNAAESILEFIDDQQVDLVSIATHGYTGLRRWVYGSVTEKVLRKANCAMLIVRPPLETLN
jgi:nucleotide-binding universal stress UspA family protein